MYVYIYIRVFINVIAQNGFFAHPRKHLKLWTFREKKT
jgi:hypothetical protein